MYLNCLFLPSTEKENFIKMIFMYFNAREGMSNLSCAFCCFRCSFASYIILLLYKIISIVYSMQFCPHFKGWKQAEKYFWMIKGSVYQNDVVQLQYCYVSSKRGNTSNTDAFDLAEKQTNKKNLWLEIKARIHIWNRRFSSDWGWLDDSNKKNEPNLQ